MISFINDLDYNRYRIKQLGGNVAGIWKNDEFFIGSNSYPIMKYHYITSQFNNFEKNIFSDDFKINYHLSGYGNKLNEAIKSFLGESSERYSFTLLYQCIKKYIIKGSYNELHDMYPNTEIIPLDLINIYINKDQISQYIYPKDTLQWIKLPSLFNEGKFVLVPLQMFILYEHNIFKKEKHFFNSAVSTGTASHETFEKSIENALTEYLQIDSYNLWWYGGIGGRNIPIDIEANLEKWFNSSILVRYFLDNFTVKFTDISFDKPLHIVVCEIESKKNLPKYVVGVQGGLDFNKCIYRSFMEAVTVLEYCMTEIWADTDKISKLPNDVNKLKIDNLDDNVLYYAKYGRQNLRKEKDFKFKTSKKAANIKELISLTKSLSKYACYLNITPPEFQNMNLVVTRVVIPELLPIALPSFPPYYHPRYKKIGGILNNVPHPMA